MSSIEETVALIRAGAYPDFNKYCELCGSLGDGVGAFAPEPDFAKRIGQPEGKQRVVFYAACTACKNALGLSKYLERIEQRILADMENT